MASEKRHGRHSARGGHVASTGVVGLLLRNKILIRSLVPLAFASCVAMILLGLLAAGRMSPEQFVERDYGGSDGSMAISDSIRPGGAVPAYQLPRKATPGPLAIQASIKFETAPGWTAYHEISLPDTISPYRNLELRDGRWPARPGEMVVTPTSRRELGEQSPKPVAGSWNLTVVGTVVDPFNTDSAAAYAAPGTWLTWDTSSDTNFDEKARATIYWTSQAPAEVIAEIISKAPPDSFVTSGRDVYYRERSEPFGARDLLERQLPALLIVLGGTIVSAGLLGRWLRRVIRPLSELGVARSELIRAAAATIGTGSVAAAGLGLGVGYASLLVGRPIVASQLDQPISPWSWQPFLALLTILGAPTVALLCALATAFAKPRVHNRRPLSSSIVRRLTIAIGVSAGVGLIASVAGVRSFWTILIIAISLSVSAAATAPLVMAFLIARKHELSPRLAAARALKGDFATHALRVASISALVVLAGATPAIAGASLASLNATSSTGVPPGIVVVTLKDDQYDLAPLEPDVLQKFESDIGISSPTSAALSFENNRDRVWIFPNVADVERVFGPLTGEQSAALNQGRLPVVSGADSAPPGSLAVAWNFDTMTEVRLGEIDDAVRPIRIYTGLTEEQDALARAWPTDNGVSQSHIKPTAAPPGFTLPARVQLAGLGIGLVVALLAGLAIRGEVARMRTLLAGLYATGLDRSWLRRLCLAMGGFIGISIAAASLAGTAAIVLLANNLMSLSVLGAPWLGIVALSLGSLVGGLAAGWIAAPSLKPTDRHA